MRYIGRFSSKNRDEFLVVSERLRCYLVLQYNETGLRAKFGLTQKLASDLHINLHAGNVGRQILYFTAQIDMLKNSK